MEDLQKKIWTTFVQPLMHTCGTCHYHLSGGSDADADDCLHDDYDGSSIECVEDWWEDGRCIKWRIKSWLDIRPKDSDKYKHIAIREINCMKCRKAGYCEILFEYTESGKIKSANVIQLSDGWDYKPFGSAGGTAPYCPACLGEL